MIDQYPPANGVLTSLIWRKTMSGGETSLSGYDNASQALSYTPGQEQVYLNGILLVRGDDYTATNGTSITGLSALAANDFVQVNCYNNFSVATTPATSITGTIANNQLANSSITINGNAVSLGGSVSLPGDIESVSAGTGLTGGGTSGSITLGLSTPVATTNGGTGLSSFTTGDLVYASASNTLATRSIGSTGQVLTVSGGLPTWSSPSSGALVKISSQTLNGTTAVNFDNVFTSTYLTYMVQFSNIYTASPYAPICLRFRKAGTTYQGTDYVTARIFLAAGNQTSDTFVVGNGLDYGHLFNNDNRPGSGTMWVGNVGTGVTNYGPYYYGVASPGSSVGLPARFGGSYTGSTYQMDGFRILCDYNIYGTIAVYGVTP